MLKNINKLCIIFILLLSIVFADDNYKPSTFVFPTYYHTYGIHKAGATHLFFFMGLKVRFINPQGIACVKLDSWDDPEDKHDDDELTVYGVNAGQNNIIYNKSMYALEVYGVDEKNDQRLKEPNGICANSKGDVYVADTGNHRIVRLYNPGHQLKFVTSIGDSGVNIGKFRYPRQVTMDNSGNIYISDKGNNRIQVFDKDNNFKYAFDNHGCLIEPTGITVVDNNEKHSYYKENILIVIDSCSQRINKFNLKGEFIKKASAKEFGYENSKLEYICLDYYNQLLITDSQNHCIHKLNKNLEHIISFGRKGSDDYEFIEPRGITIYRRFGQLFIAEKSAAHYYWIGTDFSLLDIKTEEKAVKIEFKITEPSWIDVHILDHEERFIKHIARRLYFPGKKTNTIKWNLRMGYERDKFLKEHKYKKADYVNPRHRVKPGEYIIKIIAEATYSSRSYFQRTEERNVMIK